MGTEVKFPCVTCTKEVQIKDHAIQCELCKSWEYINCIREVDRPSEGLYAMLCELQCNALWCICSVCRGKGSITQKVHELETRILLMDHQHQISKLLMDALLKQGCAFHTFTHFHDMHFIENGSIPMV